MLIGLIEVKEEGRTGFSKDWQGCSEGFPEGKALPVVLPDSFTFYLLFPIGFFIGPPKIHRRFYIDPPQVTLNLLPPEFLSRGMKVYHGYYARKSTKLPI